MRILAPLAALLLAACSPTALITPHKVEVQQGNYVTQDMVAKLKPGMTKSQVRFALGTPLVTDVFHKDRWDYVYRLEQKGEVTQQRRLTVYFESDKLARVEGDVVAAAARPEAAPPAAREGAAVAPAAADNAGEKQQAPAEAQKAQPAPAEAQKAQPAPAEAQKAPEEKGFFGKMLEKLGW